MPVRWHAIPLAEIFSKTESAPKGLATPEALERQKLSGPNVLPQEKPYSKIRLFLRQFQSPLMYILLTAVAISFFLKHFSDAGFIVIVLLVNTTVGFYQENKANQSLAALKKMVRIRAKVLRDGRMREVDSEDIVVGDVVVLRAGDKVPADARILKSKGLLVNEASLTGEAQSVAKDSVDVLPDSTPLPERTNLVFMGTVVEEGWAEVVVTAIGLATQIGEVVSLLRHTKERRTPLQEKIVGLSRALGAFILSLIFLILLLGTMTEKTPTEILVAALALAVSAIPEGLLPAITVILVFGTRRILKQRGLVRKLIATETLGSVTVICTDKTGTLTEGDMHVSGILTSTHELLHSDFDTLFEKENLESSASHIFALKIATLVNDAFVENPETALHEWVVRGSSTERALLLAGIQAGLKKPELEERFPVMERIGFGSDLKYAMSLHRTDEGHASLFVVGAPEEIIAHALSFDVDGKQEKLGTAQADALLEKFEAMTERGLRVIACAYRSYETPVGYQKLTELVRDLTLVGFIALQDPLRNDARDSIAKTKRAGIRTVLITGDHKLTAKAVAEAIGIDTQPDHILDGKALEAMDDTMLREKARVVSIYARVSPHHKLRIVQALQWNGEVVAMLGDGVNDAPALKVADIGVAVGSGTDVAKEVADLILLDDNFKTVVDAVEQGRVIFQNIRKVFVYLVADDFSELMLFLGTMALGLPLPLLPAQILWINLVEDGFPDIALTTEQETTGVMEEPPRDPKESILNGALKKWMAAIFVISGFAAFFSFVVLWKWTNDIAQTRAIVFSLMCVDSLIFAFSVRSFHRSIFRKDIFTNRYLVGAAVVGVVLLLLALYLPPLQRVLGTQVLGIHAWLLIFGVSFVEILFIEFFKKRSFASRKR